MHPNFHHKIVDAKFHFIQIHDPRQYYYEIWCYQETNTRVSLIMFWKNVLDNFLHSCKFYNNQNYQLLIH